MKKASEVGVVVEEEDLSVEKSASRSTINEKGTKYIQIKKID
jgi:hypothetical protein